jgi:hypothetical protein
VCSIAIAATAVVILNGCTTAHPPYAWDVYDACAAQTSSFVAMVACGKQNRLAACQPTSSCSAFGNAFTEYADALAAQVTSHEISEAVARQRFAEYKTRAIGDWAKVKATEDVAGATAAASLPPPPTYTPQPIVVVPPSR